MSFSPGVCVICGQKTHKRLCREHTKKYVYDKRFDVFRLKPKYNQTMSTDQYALFKSLRAIYKEPTIQEVTFPFNICKRYDIMVGPERLVVEYNGRQHYEFVKHFHKTKEGFEEYVRNDEEKKVAVEAAGFRYVVFSCIEKVEDVDYVRKKLLRALK